MEANNQFTTDELITIKRKEKGYTQAQLANLLGVSNKTISKWETNNGMPDISLILPLCDILNLTSDELLKGNLNILNKIQFKIYSNKRVENFDKTNENIYIYNLLILILNILFIISSYLITKNVFTFHKIIPNIGKMLSNAANSLIY